MFLERGVVLMLDTESAYQESFEGESLSCKAQVLDEGY